MKITQKESNISLEGVQENREFKIKNSAKAFTILSSGLYANKIKAIVRELSCNALDSQKAAGKEDTQFHVHLPHQKEPYFAVRDFGTGLCNEDVMSVYTTYFESTKTDSNDYIGALGLGSKSPFSYTDSFTVTAWKDGKYGVYAAYINEQGLPSISRMADGVYSDPELTGVEVKFPVSNASDFRRFKTEAEDIFEYFSLQPVVKAEYFNAKKKNYIMENIIDGCHLLKSRDTYSDCEIVAVQGNIGYPVNINKLSFFSEYTTMFSGSTLEMHFDIGDLDIAASREELSYCEVTIANIKSRFDKILASLTLSVEDELKGIASSWDLYPKIVELHQKKLLQNAVDKYISDNKLGHIFTTSWRNLIATGKISSKDLDKDHLCVRCLYRYSDTLKRKTHKSFRDTSTGEWHDVVSFDYTQKTLFVFNDTNVGVESRFKYHYSKKLKDDNYKQVLIFNCRDKKNRDAMFKKAIKDFDKPVHVVYASTFEKKPVKERLKVKPSDFIELQSSGYYDTTYSWQPSRKDIDLSDTATKYYVPVSGMSVIEPRLNDTIKAVARYLDNADMSVNIIGVRKGSIDEVKKLSNWVNIVDHITNELKTTDFKKQKSAEKIASLFTRKFFNVKALTAYETELHEDHIFNTLVTQYREAKKNYTKSVNEATLIQIGRCVGYTVLIETDDTDVDAVKKELDNIFVAYPMLKFISYSNDFADEDEALKAYIDYVKWVDAAKSK